MDGTQTGNAAAAIRALAERYNVVYRPTTTDAWAQHVTRLAGDDVELDDTELLLIALQRAGHISRTDAVLLQADYLAQAKPRPSIHSTISRHAAICATSPVKKTPASSSVLNTTRS
jgi:hypothetical protein